MQALKKISSICKNRFGDLHQKYINRLLDSKKTIAHNKKTMSFYTPNSLNRYRINTFSSKEPDTLSWIDTFAPDSVFWDVGANIGLYSVYAAKTKNIQVFAFEPSVFNLELLAKNIHLNNLQKQILISPIALSDTISFNLFKMRNPIWGSALSTFGEKHDQYGNTLNSTFEYSTLGISGDHVIELLKVPMPRYLKIDVDGIEHIILKGCLNLLKNVDSVLIEINDDFTEQAKQCEQLLTQSNLTLRKKFNLGNGNMYNQLWTR
jgi:FkbM family methyltransferase